MKPLFLGIALAVFSMGVVAADQSVIDRYNKACSVCHSSGVANAPKFGDAAQWKPRLDKGMDTMLNSVKNGLGAMPPKAMCFDCGDEEYMALIGYMAAGK